MDIGLAFARLVQTAQEAQRFGRHRTTNGSDCYGWLEAPPGEAPLDSQYRFAWLRHIFFEPLSNAKVAKLTTELGRAIPSELNIWLTQCSNGLSLFSDELEIFGLQEFVDAHDAIQPFHLPLETAVKVPADRKDEFFFFGAWGDGGPYYLDERDHSIHACPIDTATPVRSWNDFGTMLVDESERLVKLFDAEGRRL